jgi:ABC-type transport system involved in multi-copper enzyme maturation permease subunit
MTDTIVRTTEPGRSTVGRQRFVDLLRAESTKFRTVRGWILASLAAAVAIIALGVGPGMHGTCGTGPAACTPRIGPGGQEVTDSFYFVHQSLTGDGSITVRVTSLTGLVPAASTGRDGDVGTRPGVMPWAKAGLIIKANLQPGSAYAAVMVTGGHGVRMQYDYTEDIAGRSGAVSTASPRWLRLTRSGDTVTGDESSDGIHWTSVGGAHLAGLPATVDAGLFATSPQFAATVGGALGAAGVEGGSTQDTATFDDLDRHGTWPDRSWTGVAIGGPDNADAQRQGGFQPTASGFTVSGSGDIAPSVSGGSGLGTTITQTLIGTFVGLTIVVIVAVMFITAEYRRGLIRITLAAMPRRGRLLVAKAVVLGAIAFVLGLVAATVVVTVGQRVLRDNGVYVHPATLATQVRLVVGTAALLGCTAVLALAIGSVVRRSVVAIASAIVVIVVPYLLAVAFLPGSAAQWLLRVTPAAAFAIQQSAVRYPQVDNVYAPAEGFFPLGPWTGFAVLVGWTAVVLSLAMVLINRRDA